MKLNQILLLGAVQQFQPTYGYFIRRELLTWRVDEWANLQPGSIYHGLRTLERDGYLATVSTRASGNRPARRTYQLTDTGHQQFLTALRSVIWQVQPFNIQHTMTMISFMHVLSREELISALKHRILALEALITSIAYDIESVRSSPTTPTYVSETYDFTARRLEAEREWTSHLLERVGSGAHSFAGDESDI